MPEPVSTAVAVVAGASLLAGLNRRNPSVSEEGQFVYDQVAEFREYASQPVSMDRVRHAALRELGEILAEHEEGFAEGEEWPVVEDATLDNVRAFLAALPEDVPDPDFTVEPDDGAVSLEWTGGYRRVASVSIGAGLRIAFASLQGTDVSNGAYRIEEGDIPTAVLSAIREVAV